jgi:hypothetical protein
MQSVILIFSSVTRVGVVHGNETIKELERRNLSYGRYIARISILMLSPIMAAKES